MAALLSVNVGLPKDVDWEGRRVHTGVWKFPVTGARTVRRLNVDGDGQGDLQGHGGENRAVLVYQLDSYEYWQQQLNRTQFEYGQFGENFTVDGLPDSEVCIGDRYRIGTAEFEVTQPRVTCFRVAMRLGVPELPSLLVSHHRPGFYLRVITEGVVEAGDQIVQTASGRHQISVADIDALLYLPGRDTEMMRQALDIPALSPGWQGSFRDLLSADHNVAAPDEAEPAWTGFRPLRVTAVVPESSTVTSIYLKADDGQPLPRALPGQYLTLRVGAAGDPAPVRSYSLSSAPGSDVYRLSVKREAHGLVSTYLNTRLAPDAVFDVAAPRGDFVLLDQPGPVLLISGGIGVTPVMAMLHQLAAQQSQRDVWWVHAARNSAEQALAREAHELLAGLPSAHEHLFYSAADDHGETDPSVHHARLSAAELAAIGVPATATAYLCGPNSFMTAMQQALAQLGFDPTQIHTELFGALGAINPGVVSPPPRAPHLPPGPPATGPLVSFSRSGISARIGAAQHNVLELAELCDVPTRWSCRTGVCHTCVTPLLSGEVSYSPEPLDPAPPGTVLVCCAQPVTDLVLDM
jgi:ferredoxin-NADP reductase/MOSC domain-containing protein YiiM